MDILVIVLLLLFAGREVLAYRERKDMLDRLMARSLPEYKDNATPEQANELTDPDDGTVPIDQAESDLVGGDHGEED